MQRRLDWDRDGADWPHREASQFIACDGLRWHVQRFACGTASSLPAPRCLLIHGTGSSTHSWRDVVPLLQPHFEVLAIDLPGHAFTSLPGGGLSSPQLSLAGMARALAHLLVVGSLDATVPPDDADRVIRRLAPGAPLEKVVLEGLGHLAHEEQPGRVVQVVMSAWHAAMPVRE